MSPWKAGALCAVGATVLVVMTGIGPRLLPIILFETIPPAIVYAVFLAVIAPSIYTGFKGYNRSFVLALSASALAATVCLELITFKILDVIGGGRSSLSEVLLSTFDWLRVSLPIAIITIGAHIFFGKLMRR
jgi:hypothetical protein